MSAYPCFIRVSSLARFLVLAVILLAATKSAAQTPISIVAPKLAGPVAFDKDILPIFRKKCLACHSASEANGELVLESVAGVLKGGDTGPSVVPRKSGESLLLKVASHRQKPFMPPPGNDVAAAALTPDELGTIKLWIDEGASAGSGASILSPRTWRPLPPGVNPIYAVALSPDGQFAACGRANQIFIYHAPSGQLITRLTDPALQNRSADKLPGVAHLDLVQSLAFNPEGDMLASGGFRLAKLWKRPRDVRELSLAATDAVSAVAVSPAGDLLATASVDNSIKLWRLPVGEPRGALDGHTGLIGGLQFSPDGSTLYSASADKSIRVWSVGEKKLLARIDTPTTVAALAYFAKPAVPAAEGQPAIGERLVSAGGDNLIRVWRMPDALPQTLAEMPAKANVLASSSDRKLLAIANVAGEIRVQSAIDGKVVAAWKAHESAIHAVAFRPTPPAVAPAAGAPAVPVNPATIELATAGADRTVRIWNVATGKSRAVLRGSLSPIQSLAYKPDGKQLAAGAADGSATLWNLDLVEPKLIGVAADKRGPAAALAVSADRKLIATASLVSERPAIVVRDVATGLVTHTLLGHEGPITSLAFTADGARLASGSTDQTARVWDLKETKFAEVARFVGHKGAVSGVAFSTTGQQLVSGGADSTVRLWSVIDEKELRSFVGHSGPVVAVGMSAANQPISASADKTVRVWNPADGNAVRSLPLADAATALAITADGARLAVATADKNIQQFQVADGAPLKPLVGHAGLVKSLAYSGDGTRLVSGSADNLALAWSTIDGRLLEMLPIESGLASVAYGAGPQTIFTGDSAGALRTHTLSFALALPAFAQSVTGMAYTADGTLVLAAGADGTLRGFNSTTGADGFTANHAAPIRVLVISPDGQRVATGGDDKLVKLWTPANGAPLAPNQLAGFTAPLSALAFSGDGKRLIAASAAPAETLVFDAATGALEQSLVGHAGPVSAIAALGAAHDTIITASTDESVREWKLLAEKQIPGHTLPVTSLAVLPPPAPAPGAPVAPPGPAQFFSGSADGTVRHWNLETGVLVKQVNHGAPVTSISIRPDGSRFASASANNTARLWDAAGQQLAELRGDIRALAQVAKVTQDKAAAVAKAQIATTELAAAERDVPVKQAAAKTTTDALAAANADVTAKQGTVKTTSDAKGAAEKIAIEAAATAQKAALVKAEAEALLASAQAELKKATDKSAQALAASQAAPTDTVLAQAATQAQAAIAPADAKVKAITVDLAAKTKAATDMAAVATDAATKAVATNKPALDAAAALAASNTAQNAAAQAAAVAQREMAAALALVPAIKADLAANAARQKELDAQLLAAQQAATAAEKPLRSIAFSPDGRQLATGGDLGIVHTWDAETGKAVASHVGHKGPIAALAFASVSGLVTGSADKSVGLWNLNPGWVLARTIGAKDNPALLINRVTAVAFSADGQLLATGGGEPSRSGELKVWKVADGAPLLSLPDAHTDEIFGVCFSPDGAFVASCGADKYIRKFSLATGKQVRTFEGHTGHVLGVAWRGDGRVLASAGADNSLRIWNADNGDRIVQVEDFGKQVGSVRFIGQSPRTLTCSGNGLVRIHNSDNGQNLLNFAGATDFVYSADSTPDGRLVIAGGHDSVLRIWNGENAQVVHSLNVPAEAPTPK